MKPGTEVKIVKGDHRGKKGKVGSNRPSNALQKGKVPIVVGNKNQIIWTRPDWVLENFPEVCVDQASVPELEPKESSDDSRRELSDTEKRIVGYLMTRKVPVLDVEIAIALDLPLHQYLPALRHLEQEGLVFKNHEDGYQLASFSTGCYVADGSRTGLISSENKGVFTIAFADGNELQCTIEDLREDFTVCGKQLEPLDSSRASADSVEQPNSSADLNGSSQLKSTTMQPKFLGTTLDTTSTTEISETITPLLEPLTSTQSDSLATTQVTPATEQDCSEKNQDFGWKHSVALLRDYLNSSLSNSQKASFIAACEQSLEDSEWQATLGTIRFSYKQRKLELASTGHEFLSLPTLTASSGKTSRPSGSTKCDRTARKLGLIFDSQSLSIEMMAAISGFPLNWTACLSESKNANNGEDFKADSCTAELSSPNKPPLPSEESSISIPLLAPGRQWLNPKWIALKEGTQSRDVDELFNVNVSVVQNYTEMMEQGLWEWKREPLPVAFLSADGKIYAGDCYHRAMAAITVGENLYVNLLSGKLVDAILYSCQANTYHGLLLRPKDQRKRIELFLDTLENLDEARSHSLLDSIPGLSEAERRNCQNKWSARVIAKYLRLTESGYRTIINIQQERELALKFTQFAEGDWVSVKPDAEVGKIHSFDKRKGVFVVPTNGTGVYIHPDYLEKTDAPIEIEKISQATAPTSVQEELKQKAEKLGIPVNGLPEVERNEGDPSSLVDNSFATPGLDEVDLWAEQLSDEQIDRVWSAIAARRAEGIAPRVPLTEKFSRQIINLESFDNQDLQDLIAYANELLESRQGGMVDAS